MAFTNPIARDSECEPFYITRDRTALSSSLSANWSSQMSIANTKILLSVSRPRSDIEPLKAIVIFCGIGLLVSLLFASYGLDLSAGFF